MRRYESGKSFVALGSRLAGVPEVITLGVRPNFLDYTSRERELMMTADPLLYPTNNYAEFFTTLGKRIFPSLETHLYADEKIKQTTLFYMTGVPHPRTRVYYHLHHEDILKDFRFPFIAKLARRSAQGRGVFKISSRHELEEYLNLSRIAYIQEFIPHERDLRVVLINYEPLVSYWRHCPAHSFKANVHQGGTISFEKVPEEAVQVAQECAKKCRFDDVGIDLMEKDGKWQVVEANMKYGRTGPAMKGLNLKEVLRKKLLSGELSS
jgi:ribosomal protein S6--L-glutamate ligase